MVSGREVSFPSRSDVDRAQAGGELDSVLSALAAAASEGRHQAIDTLLYAIDSRRLAEPAIRRVVFEVDEVDDVTQNVLIAVAENVGSFRGDARFLSWLAGLARNKSIDHLRRMRDSVEFKPELGDTERISSMIATDLSIKTLLDQLPEPYRVAVTMRDVDGLPYAEIAATLGLNLNTTRSHIARGRAMLAGILAKLA